MVHQNSIFVFNGGRALRIDVLSVMFASVENQNVIFALERPDDNRHDRRTYREALYFS